VKLAAAAVSLDAGRPLRVEPGVPEAPAPRGAASATAAEGAFVGPLGKALADLSAGTDDEASAAQIERVDPDRARLWEDARAALRARGVSPIPLQPEAAAGTDRARPAPHSADPTIKQEDTKCGSGRDETAPSRLRNFLSSHPGEPAKAPERDGSKDVDGARPSHGVPAGAPPAGAPCAAAPAAEAGRVASVLSLSASIGCWLASSQGSAPAPGPAPTGAPPGASPPAALPVAALRDGGTIHVVADGPATQAARVDVRHPVLGAVQIDLRLEKGSLEVRVVAATAAMAASLKASESTLRESVALAGVELRSLRVDRPDDDGDDERARRARRRGRRRPLDTEA